MSQYELFISYAHRDNFGNPGDDVSRIQAVKLAIEREYREMTGEEVRIFLDEDAIRTGDDWRQRILLGLRQSKMLLAFVSTNYFKSEYCRLEWEHYIQTELSQALPGDGIAPVYIIRCAEFDELSLEERLRRWARDLRRRQVDVQWLDWWPYGQAALQRDDVRRRLRELSAQLRDRLSRYELRAQSPTNQMPLLTEHFKGRQRELYELRHHLVKGHVGAITAVNGIPGIGKTELALAYAWGYGGLYPAGRFYLNMAGRFASDELALERLKQQIADLAEYKRVPVSDVERQTPDLVFRKVVKAFADQPDRAALFILDNVDDPRLLNPALLAKAIPQGEQFDVILTTRLAAASQSRLAWVAVDFLEPEDGLALLDSFVPIPESPQDQEWKAAYRISTVLGGHALGLTVLAVYMRWRKEHSYVKTLDYLQREGLALVSELGDELESQRVGLDSTYAERVVERLLQPTIEHLRTTYPAAYRAFQLAAFCPPDQVPLPWLVEILTEGNPDWGADRLGGSLARQAVQMLIDYRLLVPERTQRAGLVSESEATTSQQARMHRVYVDLWAKETQAEEASATHGRLLRKAQERASHLRRNWGRREWVWEVEPLLAFADQTFDRMEMSTVRFLDDVSEVLRHVGRLADVQRLRVAGCRIMERLCEAAPENADYARDLSVSYNQMGDLFRALGDGTAARRYYEQALEVSERLAQAAPENADYARDLSVSYNKMGDLFRALGDGTAARRYYEQDLKIAERLAQAAPENADYARDLAVSYFKMYVTLASSDFAEDPKNGRFWLQRTYDTLNGMKLQGMHLSPDDLEWLRQIEQAL